MRRTLAAATVALAATVATVTPATASSPTAPVVVRVAGTAATNFHIHYADGSAVTLPHESRALARCHTMACRVEVHRRYYWVAALKRSLYRVKHPPTYKGQSRSLWFVSDVYGTRAGSYPYRSFQVVRMQLRDPQGGVEVMPSISRAYHMCYRRPHGFLRFACGQRVRSDYFWVGVVKRSLRVARSAS